MPDKKKSNKNDHELVAKIIAMRDEFKGTPREEYAGLACRGMYKCSKLADVDCLNRIIKNLEAVAKDEFKPAELGDNATSSPDAKPKKAKAKGGRPKSRSRSRSRSKTKAKPKRKTK